MAKLLYSGIVATILAFSPLAVADATSEKEMKIPFADKVMGEMAKSPMAEDLKEDLFPTWELTKPKPGKICPTLLDIIQAWPKYFSTLAAAVDVVPGLADTLDDPEAELTLFAPTNAGFTKAFESYIPLTVEQFLAIPDAVADTLLYHALGEALYTPQLDSTLTTLQGETIDTSFGKFALLLKPYLPETVQVIAPNVPACKSVLHVIDLVMVPEEVADLF